MPMISRTSHPDKARIEKRNLRSAGVNELYLTATPAEGLDLEAQARQLYEAIRDELRTSGARLFCERFFATRDAVAVIERIRREGDGAGKAFVSLFVTLGADIGHHVVFTPAHLVCPVTIRAHHDGRLTHLAARVVP